MTFIGRIATGTSNNVCICTIILKISTGQGAVIIWTLFKGVFRVTIAIGRNVRTDDGHTGDC